MKIFHILNNNLWILLKNFKKHYSNRTTINYSCNQIRKGLNFAFLDTFFNFFLKKNVMGPFTTFWKLWSKIVKIWKMFFL